MLFRKCCVICNSICVQVRYNSNATFKCANMVVKATTKKKQTLPDLSNVAFGSLFSDLILKIEYSLDRGWGQPVIEQFDDLKIHPAAKVLHYSPTVFEGMKAYRGPDDKIRLFRPELNARRLLSSSKRAALPGFDEKEFISCLKKFIALQRDFIPPGSENKPHSLYIRPVHMAIEPTLGIDCCKETLLYVVLSPVGPYYPTGLKPVTLLADPQYVRSWPGGCGAYKMGANYAPTLAIQDTARTLGCQQCLWLFGPQEEITEVGSMNLMMFWVNEHGEKELITAPLEDGTILPGITCASIIELAQEKKEYKVSRRRFTMQMVLKALNENRVKEIFGTGTAAIVCPVERILYRGKMYSIPTMSSGAPVCTGFYKDLLNIQYGKKTHKDWTQIIT